jgi:hypothetical protein
MDIEKTITAACHRAESLIGQFPDHVVTGIVNSEINFVRNKLNSGLALLRYDLDAPNPATMDAVVLPVDIEDGQPIMPWLWERLQAHSDAQAVLFFFKGAEDDSLCTILLENDVYFVATGPVSNGGRITGQWRVERHSRPPQA